MATKQRMLYAYSLHTRAGGDVVDYQAFFRDLANQEAVTRQTSLGAEIVGLPLMRQVGQRWLIRFVAGEEGVPPVYYDVGTGQEREGTLDGEVLVAHSLALFDPVSRVVIVERRRPGVGVGVIARSLALIATELRMLPEPVRFDLNPIPAESFVEELDQLDRIRTAAVVLSRPNYSWTDNAADMTGYADESDANSVELEMKAARGGSLNKQSGIIPDIKALLAATIGPLKDLRVRGRRLNEEKERTVSMSRHQEKRTIDASADLQDFQDVAVEFTGDLTKPALNESAEVVNED